MRVEYRSATAGDVEEGEVVRQEPADGGLVRRVQDGPAGAAVPGHLEAEVQCRERVAVHLLEVERLERLPVEPLGRPNDALRVQQRELDGQPHVRGGELREDRAVGELDERVDDGLRVNDHVDLLGL